MTTTPELQLPPELIPGDGRFGAGPSKVRSEAVAALAEAAPDFLGTSHRRPAVRSVFHRVREGISSLFSLPDGYEVLFSNGGTTSFWDAAAFGLIEHRSQHLVFGEFSSKFASITRKAPHLDDPEVIESATGTHPLPEFSAEVDAYCFPHNETSTGVMLDPRRPEGATAGPARARRRDVRRGWAALRSRAERRLLLRTAEVLRQRRRPVARGLLTGGDRAHREDQRAPIAGCHRASTSASRSSSPARTRPTTRRPSRPSSCSRTRSSGCSTRAAWSGARTRCDQSADILYGWAEASSFATPYVEKPDERSHVTATIDFDDAVDAAAVAKALRANGIVDTEPYRKLGRNQLRIGIFPAVEPDDVATLTKAIDYLVERV